MIYTHSSFNY